MTEEINATHPRKRDPISGEVAAPSLSNQAYARLLKLLSSGELSPDTRLPSEARMALDFGVSRPVLRQALERLRAEERIYSRKGSGHYVCSVDTRPPAISFGPLNSIPDVRDFLKFRVTLEKEAAALAAELLDAEHFVNIRTAHWHMKRALAARQSGIDEDFAFHAAIARASGNRFYALTMEGLADQMRFSIRLIRDLSTQSLEPRKEAVLDEHERIVSAIAAKDAEGARRAMEAHLLAGIERLFGS